MLAKKITLLLLSMSVVGCGTNWEKTQPSRTALEQILLSSAAERATANLSDSAHSKIKQGLDYKALGKSYINSEHFKGYDKAYAIHSIQRYFLENNLHIVTDKADAETVIDISAGALSIDKTDAFFGLPEMGIPVPFSGKLELPEITLYKNEQYRSLAKFSMTFRDAKTGQLKRSSLTGLGTAQSTSWTILLLFDFTQNDLQLPKNYPQLGDY